MRIRVQRRHDINLDILRHQHGFCVRPLFDSQQPFMTTSPLACGSWIASWTNPWRIGVGVHPVGEACVQEEVGGPNGAYWISPRQAELSANPPPDISTYVWNQPLSSIMRNACANHFCYRICYVAQSNTAYLVRLKPLPNPWLNKCVQLPHQVAIDTI